MTHEINQLFMGLGISLVLAIITVLGVINSNIIQDYKETKRIFKDFCKGEYQYIGHYGEQVWFSRNDEVGQSFQYNEIIFFGQNGGIKLHENYYIHKGLLTFTFVHRYYYKKFHRVKEQYIHRHVMSEQFRNIGGVYVRDHSVKSRELSSFKFFRG